MYIHLTSYSQIKTVLLHSQGTQKCWGGGMGGERFLIITIISDYTTSMYVTVRPGMLNIC